MRSRLANWLVWLFLVPTTGPTRLVAQAPSGTVSSPAVAPSSPGFCYRPQRLPRCDSYLVFELTGTRRLGGTHSFRDCPPPTSCPEEDLKPYLAWDIGWMTNRDSTHSQGVSFEVGGSEEGTRLALRARRRLWLQHQVVMDLGAGPLMSQYQAFDRTGTKPSYGLTGEAGVGIARIGVLAVSADVTKRPNHAAVGLHAGARTEGLPAGFASLVVSVLSVALVLALREGY
jgi:hypothetical protein